MAVLAVRTARAEDLAAINAIYNHYVESSTCTFQVEPETMADRVAWFAEHDDAHPAIVAEREAEVVGWGALSRFHSRCAYRYTVEPSVYVRHDLLGQGIGSALVGELIARARAAQHHSIVAVVCTEIAASFALCERLGFAKVAHLREVGHKSGRWLDVAYMQLML